MAEWIDTSEKWPGSMPGMNYTAENVGPWEIVRVARASLESAAGWKIHAIRGGAWREIGIVYRTKEEAMRAVEAAAADPATRLMVLAADKLDAAAAEAWRLAGEAAAKAAEVHSSPRHVAERKKGPLEGLFRPRDEGVN